MNPFTYVAVTNNKNFFNLASDSDLDWSKSDIILKKINCDISNKNYCVLLNIKKNNLMISEMNQNGFEFRDNIELVKILSNPVVTFGKLSKKIFGIVKFNDLGIKLLDLNQSNQNNPISSGLPMHKIDIKLNDEYINLINSSSDQYIYLKLNIDEKTR
jgi:hypothetical protein